MSETNTFCTVDGRRVPLAGQRNLLELIREAGIELPTFCYHSELSVYGACRLCLVEIEGRGIQGACSVPPEPGMVVHTRTEKVREIRKIAVELLLANHDCNCPTCPKNGSCQLQALARQLGVRTVRYRSVQRHAPLDVSSPSLVRDPNRCVLCGDCTRVCAEVQGIGAIDFAYRGCDAAVVPSFGRALGEVECVGCGQCAAVCPTGALTPRSEVEGVWAALGTPGKKVVVQIAPAVRVALAEAWHLPPGAPATGLAVAALRTMGFAAVYDTAFAADLTVIEEAEEFLGRVGRGERLPQFTSCCPAWVRYAEQYHPQLLTNLSSCRSPQQMLGALAKATLPTRLGVARAQLTMVAVMPCTAKKAEAQRPELRHEGQPDVDFVLTTQELLRMVEEAGLDPARLEPASFDLPLGFKTGGGVIFGRSGGVTEAVLRYAAERLDPSGGAAAQLAELQLDGPEGVREAVLTVGGRTLRLALVHGLANAGALAERVEAGEGRWDLIEVMACPGGCVGGAGQPVVKDATAVRRRAASLGRIDRELDLHRAQDNPFVNAAYRETLGTPGSETAHGLLHTHYQHRRRLQGDEVALGGDGGGCAGCHGTAGVADGCGAAVTPGEPLDVRVCVGTSCFVRGAQSVLQRLLGLVEEENLQEQVDLRASFCFEACDRGPTVVIGGRTLHHCDPEQAVSELRRALAAGATASHAPQRPTPVVVA